VLHTNGERVQANSSAECIGTCDVIVEETQAKAKMAMRRRKTSSGFLL
jgi:hypothetical protein